MLTLTLDRSRMGTGAYYNRETDRCCTLGHVAVGLGWNKRMPDRSSPEMLDRFRRGAPINLLDMILDSLPNRGEIDGASRSLRELHAVRYDVGDEHSRCDWNVITHYNDSLFSAENRQRLTPAQLPEREQGIIDILRDYGVSVTFVGEYRNA